MDCFLPGRVLLAPQEFGITEIESRIAEEIGLPFHIEFGIDEIVKRYSERRIFEGKPAIDRFPLPIVGRVPEGAEQDAAARLLKLKVVGAACPDYRVDMSAAAAINAPAIDRAITEINAMPVSPSCGSGAIVGVLDSGVDAGALTDPTRLFHIQFDVTDPYDRGRQPTDRVGHGTLVAAIIQKLAPAADLLSIRISNGSSSLSGAIAGLYLAAENGCNIINMSFSVSCDARPCGVCRTPSASPASVPQMAYFFDRFRQAYPDCVLIAAAGNREGYRDPPVAMPAVFSGLIAVGQVNDTGTGPSANSLYGEVPADRYVLAPGGSRDLTNALATVQPYSKSEALYGTSFSAAFVSGIASRYVCGYFGGECSVETEGLSLPDHILRQITKAANRAWPAFQPSRHGIGALQYRYAP